MAADESDGGSVSMSSVRLEGLSDAVFAIAITLLVLDIRQPEAPGPLWDALVQQWPSFAAYALSFVLIGVVWINHHEVFHYIARADRALIWLNLLLLMDVAFMPYPTVLLANALINERGQATAAVCYGATLVVGGVLFNATWWHASRHHRLLYPDVPSAVVRALGRRLLGGPLFCALVTPLAFVQVGLALAGYLLLLGYFGATTVRAEPARSTRSSH